LRLQVQAFCRFKPVSLGLVFDKSTVNPFL
jgi:hypothetical protein